MYKVLIVEDMDLTREDLIQLIDWEANGFLLLPDARNGKIGLDYALRYRPDIIITDIKMPIMTGLDMIQKLEQQGVKCQVILFTAYEEFDLAKRALQMESVKAFLLKYEIEKDLLLSELNKRVMELEGQKQIRRLQTRKKILELLRGNGKEIQPEEHILGWNGRTSLVLLRRMDADREPGACSEENLQEQLEEAFPKERLLIFQVNARDYVVLFQERVFLSRARRMEYLREMAVRLLEEVQKALGALMMAAVGDGEEDWSLERIFRRAAQRMRGSIFANSGVIFTRDVDEERTALSQEAKALLGRISEDLEGEDYRDVYRRLQELQRLLMGSEKLYWVDQAEDKLLHFLVHRAIQMRLDGLEEEIAALKESRRELQLAIFFQRYEALLLLLEEQTGDRYSGKVRYIRSYIQKNYAKDISLNQLAGELGMNPIYLSSLFKKEMGTTFSSYLTDVRMEKAMALLKSGDYKVYEISEMVGYQTVQYFNKVFKKRTGKNPTEYC